MKFTVGFMGNKELDGKTFSRFSEAVKAVLKGVADAINKNGFLPAMILEQGIWIETESEGRKLVMLFDDLRDLAFDLGILKGFQSEARKIILAKEGEYAEPDELSLKQAFMRSTIKNLRLSLP